MRKFIFGLCVFIFCFDRAGYANAAAPDSPDSKDVLKTFDLATQIIIEQNTDPAFKKDEFQALIKQGREKLVGDLSEVNLKRICEALFSKLTKIRPKLFSIEDQEYWIYQAIFAENLEAGKIRQIGVIFTRIGKRWYIKNVFKNSPAWEAGLLPGDEMVTVDGESFKPVESFRSIEAKNEVKVAYKRVPWEKPREVKVKIIAESFLRLMLREMISTANVISLDSKKIGYLKLLAAVHPEISRMFKERLESFAKSNVDSLILDLRDGFAGADYTQYLTPFFDTADSKTKAAFSSEKPIIVLINKGTTSGKEWVAHYLRLNRKVALLGEKTEGRYLPAKMYNILGKKYTLYFPGAGAKPDDFSIQGKGLVPDTIVDQALVYSGGGDPQLQKALELLKGL